MTPVRIVVLACGNEARGDDGVGEAFAARAAARPAPPGVILTFVTDVQFQPEHALDVAGHDLALFVDAGHALARPCALREVRPAGSLAFSTHGMTPEAVLDAYGRVYDRPAPPAFALAIRAPHCGLGRPMSDAARQALDQALALFAAMCASPSAAAWRTLAASA
jgi:hydrogenase maturation protease